MNKVYGYAVVPAGIRVAMNDELGVRIITVDWMDSPDQVIDGLEADGYVRTDEMMNLADE